MKNKKLSKVFAAAMAGGVILSSIAFVNASAETTTQVATTTNSTSAVQSNCNKPEPQKGLGEEGRGPANKGARRMDIAAAVTANIITQAESDSITTYLSANKNERNKNGKF